MENKSGRTVTVRVVKDQSPSPKLPIKKAESTTQISESDQLGSEWLEPSYNLAGLKEMVRHSTILPQCVHAMKENVAGFGLELTYRDDIKETEPMKEEWTRVQKVLDLLSLDKDPKVIFEECVESREIYGVGYLEAVRDANGAVFQVEFIRDTPTVSKTRPLEPAVEYSQYYNGEMVTRWKQFRKYRQQKAGKIVYFKEFGDPRIMDRRTGDYVDSLDIEHRANEILELALGTEDYGEPRWIGQVLNVDGSRRAEALNHKYFTNGRHTPLLIMLRGGKLSDDSYSKLQSYMNDIKGEAGQHAFLLLEVEDNEERSGFEQDKKPEVEIKDMAAILQKDELFQEYLDNSRRKAQSSFRLPDLYVGYTTDFNRATAQMAMEVTEKQVFIPERKRLAWLINNKLLNWMQLKYVEVGFKAPDITNPEDIARILAITERAGGVTPNVAKELTMETLGKTAEPYPEEWGNLPMAMYRGANGQMLSNPILPQLTSAITKAEEQKNNEDVVAIMKEVRRLLIKQGVEE